MARKLFNEARVVRELAVARSFSEAENNDRREWRLMSPLKRIEMIEVLRQMNHPYDPDTARLPRVFQVVKQASR
jgi:hypothetical protein